MATIIVHSDRETERVKLLGTVLHGLGEAFSQADSLEAVRRSQGSSPDGRTLVLVPDIEGDGRLADEAITFAEATPGAFVVYIADAISAEVYKRLLRSRRGEWVQWHAAARELAEVIVQSRTDHAPRAAKVVSFLPSKGGVGNTTLALEVGVLMAAGDKKTPVRVAVVDLNFHGGTLSDFLDLPPRLDIAEVISHPERLDEQLVDIFASRHSSNLDVFSSPARTIKGEQVGPRVVFALLDQLGKRYDLVLLDILHHWLPWVDNVLQGSDAVIITGGGTVPAVKQLANRVRYVEDLEIPSKRIAVVVNQCEIGLFGQVPRKAEIDRTFRAREVRYIPLDLATATLAANTGRPMVELASRRPVSKSIRQLVNWIQTVTQPTEAYSK